MDERDFEELVNQALIEFAKAHDIPISSKTLTEKGFSEDPGLIVQIGEDEFFVNLSQTVSGGE